MDGIKSETSAILRSQNQRLVTSLVKTKGALFESRNISVGLNRFSVTHIDRPKPKESALNLEKTPFCYSTKTPLINSSLPSLSYLSNHPYSSIKPLKSAYFGIFFPTKGVFAPPKPKELTNPANLEADRAENSNNKGKGSKQTYFFARNKLNFGPFDPYFDETRKEIKSATAGPPNAMGWSQPTVGKRARRCSDENSSEFNQNTENQDRLADNNGGDMKTHFGKRPRDVSPLKDKDNATPMDSSDEDDDKDAAEYCGNPGTSCDRDRAKSGLNVNAAGCSKDLMKVTKEGETSRERTISGGSGSGSSSEERNFDEFLGKIRTCSPYLSEASRSSSKMCSKPTGFPSGQKGPRVVTSYRIKSAEKKKFKKTTKTGLTSAIQNSSSRNDSDNNYEDEDEEEEEDDIGVLDGDLDSKCYEDSVDESEPSSRTPSVDVIPVSSVIRRVLPSIRPSYFPFVPPYINFCLHDERTETLPSEIKRHLKWRLSPITPNVVKKTLTNSGYRILRKTVEWGGQWGKHMKAVLFKTNLKDFQKLNHLPGTFQLGRKDRLWRNLHRYMMKFGKEEFGFIPRSYCLPQDLKQLKSAWEASEQKKQLWIVKPPAGARGTGIRVVNKWNQISKKKPVIVQSYISNPYLINDRKFDLRLYVLVTSFHPLKVYVYNDGLVRFAPVKYSDDAKRAGDRFMHLTNYSINKNCELYTHNEDADSCEGHKWTVKTLWKYLGEQGINTNALWDKIEEIVIKTFISAEEPITNSAHCLPNSYNGYELFGFDIILDSELKPWLLEVNISPSLHSSSPLDLAVKGPMIKEVFNIVGYQIPPKLSAATKAMFMNSLDVSLELETPVFDRRIFTSGLSKEELHKHRAYKSKYDKRAEYLQSVLEYLTPDDVRHLIVSEDELSQCQGFCRIFPSATSHSYFPYFETPKYYNILLDAWEGRYHGDRSDGVKLLVNLCHQKIHLQVPITSNVIYESPESKTSEEELGTSVVTKADNINEAKTTAMADAEVENQLNGNVSSSISPSPVTAVLDNITNNNMRSLGTSNNNGAINNCHDEDRLANEKTATPIANKVGDYVVKGMCF